MKGQSHGNVFIAALIFVALALTTAAGLYLLQTRPSQSPPTPITQGPPTAEVSPKLPSAIEVPTTTASPTPTTTDETANWKTYINNELGISFKYPQRLNLSQPVAGGGVMNVILFSGTSKPDSIHLNYAQFSQDINQLILKAKAGQTEMPVYSTLDYSTSENITIGGRSGIKYSDSTGNVGVYFLGDKYGFLFYSGITNGEEINQILATFRFD